MSDQWLKILMVSSTVICVVIGGIIGWNTVFISGRQYMSTGVAAFLGLYVPWIVLFVVSRESIIQSRNGQDI